MTTQSIDPLLLQRLQRGEPQACLAFHRAHAPGIYLLVFRITRDQLVAEDIVTDSFVIAFSRVPDFADLENMKSFLYTTAYRKALDYLRAQKVRSKVHAELLRNASEASGDLEQQFIVAETLSRVYQAIEALPVNQRDVIKKNLVEGKTLQEVAAELQIAYKTVQNYKLAGLKSLRLQLLQDDLSGPALAFVLAFLMG